MRRRNELTPRFGVRCVMRFLSAFLLLTCLIVSGCADSDKSSDNNNRFGGFYGGVIGGGGAAR